jgi:hypothetical protein
MEAAAGAASSFAAASAQGDDDDVDKAACFQPAKSSFSLDIELGILTGTCVAGECNFGANTCRIHAQTHFLCDDVLAYLFVASSLANATKAFRHLKHFALLWLCGNQSAMCKDKRLNRVSSRLARRI